VEENNIMKKYQKPRLTMLDFSVRDEIAALIYRETITDGGGLPLSRYSISSFNELSGEEE